MSAIWFEALTPAALHWAGERLFGRHWQSPMTGHLGIDHATLRRWLFGCEAIPPWVGDRLSLTGPAKTVPVRHEGTPALITSYSDSSAILMDGMAMRVLVHISGNCAAETSSENGIACALGETQHEVVPAVRNLLRAGLINLLSDETGIYYAPRFR